jgi:hypothetical protein
MDIVLNKKRPEPETPAAPPPAKAPDLSAYDSLTRGALAAFIERLTGNQTKAYTVKATFLSVPFEKAVYDSKDFKAFLNAYAAATSVSA